MEKIINGRKYVLKSYSHLEQTILEDCAYEIMDNGRIKSNRALVMSLTIFFSLVSWDVKDASGKDCLLPVDRVKTEDIPRLDMDAYLLFAAAFPKADREELFVAASKLNRLGEEEKKSSPESSVEK